MRFFCHFVVRIGFMWYVYRIHWSSFTSPVTVKKPWMISTGDRAQQRTNRVHICWGALCVGISFVITYVTTVILGPFTNMVYLGLGHGYVTTSRKIIKPSRCRYPAGTKKIYWHGWTARLTWASTTFNHPDWIVIVTFGQFSHIEMYG